MDFVKYVEDLVNEYMKENANICFSNNFVELQAQAVMQKEIAKRDLGSKLLKCHYDGLFHIHDLGFWMRGNCLQHPMYKVLMKGLYALGCVSKPAKHLDTALSHTVNALSLGQAHLAGGQSVPSFNVLMSPYVEGLSEKELEQCIQQFIFQINQISPSRGLQTIFASVNMSDSIPRDLGKLELERLGCCFGDFSDEMMLFMKKFIEVLNKGDGVGKPFAFPNTIIYIKDENKYDDELKKLIIQNMMKNSNVYFLNGFKYGNELATAMGCVDGKEVVIYRYKGNIFVESFERMWSRFECFGVKKYGISEYIEVPGLEIYDSRNGFVGVKRIIRNPDKGDWIEVRLDGGRSLLVTSDHPFLVKSGEVKEACRLTLDDEIPVIYEYKFPELKEVDMGYAKVREIRFIGYRGEFSYDVETESGYFDVSGVYSHNCRTYLDDTKTGNIFKDVFGTGNLSYVTLNIPGLALRVGGVSSKFYDLFEDVFWKAVKVLLVRRARLWKCWNEGFYPFFMEDAYIDENGYYYNLGYTTMSLGIVGISDVERLMSDFDGLEFVKMFRDMIDELNEYEYVELANKFGIKYDNFGNDEISRWSLIGSPAESCSVRFKKIDNELFADELKRAGIYDRKYYINSIMVDESESMSAIKKVLKEEKYHKYLNGGIILHLWNAFSSEEIDELSLWDWFIKVMKRTDVRYLTVSNTICFCPECKKKWIGSSSEFKCKYCDNENIKKYAKITGYISEVSNWNEGKLQEFYRRARFSF